jgi:hypothetical protein
MTKFDNDYNDDNHVMILNDGETYTGLSGSSIGVVLWDNWQAPPTEQLTIEELEELAANYEKKGKRIWMDKEGMILVEILTIFN